MSEAETLRQPAEVSYAAELAARAPIDSGPRPDRMVELVGAFVVVGAARGTTCAGGQPGSSAARSGDVASAAVSAMTSAAGPSRRVAAVAS